MKLEFRFLIAFVSTTILQGCDPSGFGCTHTFSFIPTTEINHVPLSRRSVTVGTNEPAVVKTSSYLTNGEAFILGITVENTSKKLLVFSDLKTLTTAGELIQSQSKVQWTNRCKPPTCDELLFSTDSDEMVLFPSESVRLNVTIKLSAVENINELEHQINFHLNGETEPYSLAWSMTRIEQRINCVNGNGHHYRLVTDI